MNFCLRRKAVGSYCAVVLGLLLLTGCAKVSEPVLIPPLPSMTAFRTGHGPSAIAYDGEHIWIANKDDNTLTSLRSDGGVIGVYAAGKQPSAIAYGDGYIWVSNSGEGTVSQFTLSGQLLHTFAVDGQPTALAYWQNALWVIIYDSGEVLKMSHDGRVVARVFVGKHPRALAAGSTFLWVVSQGDSSLTALDGECTVLAVHSVSGSPSPTVFGARETGPAGIAFDGAYLWLTFPETGALLRVNELGIIAGYFSQSGGPGAVAIGADSVWIANTEAGTLTRLDAKRDGFPLATFPIGQTPIAVLYDSSHIWVVNQADDAIVRLDF